MKLMALQFTFLHGCSQVWLEVDSLSVNTVADPILNVICQNYIWPVVNVNLENQSRCIQRG